MTPDQYRREGAEAMREAALNIIRLDDEAKRISSIMMGIRAIDVDAVLAGLKPRCAECDCEGGNCTWIKAGPDAPARLVEADKPRAWVDVMGERVRQITVEGWTPEHDDYHYNGEMARAASCYAWIAAQNNTVRMTFDAPLPTWPHNWASDWWKPTDRRRDLVKAGALILAEIERLDRTALAAMETDQ